MWRLEVSVIEAIKVMLVLEVEECRERIFRLIHKTLEGL